MQEKEDAFNHYKQMIERSIEMPKGTEQTPNKGEFLDIQVDSEGEGERDDDPNLEDATIEANLNFIEK